MANKQDLIDIVSKLDWRASVDIAWEIPSHLCGTKRCVSSAYESESESESKSASLLLYCRLSSPSFGETEWLTFDALTGDSCIESEKKKKKKKKEKEAVGISSKPKCVDPLNCCSSCAVVGSDIYIIGGGTCFENQYVGVTDVYRLDTVTREVCKRASMAVGRVSPHTFVIDGKIYVMGGTIEYMFSLDAQRQWAEVYDPILDKWEFLPPPPTQYMSNSSMFTAVLHSDSEAKILVGLSYMLKILIYNVKTQTWQMSGCLPSKLGISGQAVTVDDVIYCWNHGKLYAYHVYNHTLVWTTAARIGLLGIKYAFLETHPARLVHVAAHKFCLVWVNDGELHCVMLEALLSKSLGGGHYVRTFIRWHLVHYVPPLLNHADAFLMDGKA